MKVREKITLIWVPGLELTIFEILQGIHIPSASITQGILLRFRERLDFNYCRKVRSIFPWWSCMDKKRINSHHSHWQLFHLKDCQYAWHFIEWFLQELWVWEGRSCCFHLMCQCHALDINMWRFLNSNDR